MQEKPLIICRCEEITKEEIIAAIKNGARTVDSVRRMTRAGMGLCQGRSCEQLVLKMLAEALDCNMQELSVGSKRVPTCPQELGVLKSGNNPH